MLAAALGAAGLAGGIAWRKGMGGEGAALRARAAAARSGAARSVIDALALQWQLEAEGVRESESAWAAWRSARDGKEPVGSPTEDDLRAFLRERRPVALRKSAEVFIEILDEPSRSTIESSASQLGISRSDFVIDWLTYQGVSRLEILEKLWKEPLGFPALGNRVVDSAFEGAAVPPSQAAGFQVLSRTETSIVARLFGCKLHAALAPDAAKDLEDPVRSVTIESNHHRLRHPLVALPESVDVPVTASPAGGYLVGWKPEIEEYLRTGNREEWRLEALGPASPAAGPAPASEVVPASATAKLEPDHVLFEKLSPAVPMIETGGGSGSGFVVDAGGRAAVITNLHVVLGAQEEVTVRFFKPGSTEVSMSVAVKAESCRAHEKADLVLIPIEDWKPLTQLRGSGIHPIPLLEKGRALKVGEPVLKIGHPGGGEGALIGSVGRGMVSGPPRPFGREGILFIQMTVNINPGDSGGPLLDSEGRVIGVSTMRQVFAGGLPSSDINFALDVSYVKELMAGSGTPLPAKQKEVFQEEPLEARRVETEMLIAAEGYSLPDAKNTLSLTLPPDGEAERKLELKPGVAYAFWTVGMRKDALVPEQVAVELSGASSVTVSKAPLGGLLYVTPKQAGRHSLLLKNLSNKEIQVLVSARRKDASAGRE